MERVEEGAEEGGIERGMMLSRATARLAAMDEARVQPVPWVFFEGL